MVEGVQQGPVLVGTFFIAKAAADGTPYIVCGPNASQQTTREAACTGNLADD